jgi:predicted DNA-binding transcriptional regulator AlpA
MSSDNHDHFVALQSPRRLVWTEESIRALGAITDLPTVASIFGLGRALAYELAKNGNFPVPVIRVGSRYRVPVAPILAALQLAPDPPT